MCGIAGIYRFGATSPGARERAEDRARVAAMLRTIEYRGPDDAGLEQPGRVTFGARRLSILDVVGGHQPLSDASGRVWATQNGELYDFPRLRSELAGRHRFRTHTDTELLPALWLEHGAAAVEGLRGMFALAIHDTADGTLMLARDPLGVKPLYWARLGDRLLFASEMKALLTDPALPRDLDPEGMRRFLALGFVPGERTAFTAICKLRPGCRMLVTPSGMKIERYWAWPDFAADPAHAGASLDSLADQVGARLAESTRAMLLSDRPVGVLLSGGVDSSLLVALLPEEIRRETRTFSIGFEGGGLHDERPHARRVAEAMGTKHQESVAAFDLERELPRVVALLDEPCADPAALPAHLVARAAAEHVTVVLPAVTSCSAAIAGIGCPACSRTSPGSRPGSRAPERAGSASATGIATASRASACSSPENSSRRAAASRSSAPISPRSSPRRRRAGAKASRWRWIPRVSRRRSSPRWRRSWARARQHPRRSPPLWTISGTCRTTSS
jgi:asparagine synthase (glutamine-hydrolysing)